ncbi:MAG: DNA-protecting protein DprA [Gammaproteobacteria bacterium]|nr:DNA-protecting protein DprA [Gammaproteobacteria bacterium]
MDSTSRWLTLVATPGLGPITLKRLIQRAGSPDRLLRAPVDQLTNWGLPTAARAWLRRPNLARIAEQRAQLAEIGARLISLSDPAYPPLLKEIPDAPLVLFVRGDKSLLTGPQLAIVGSRNPSPGGRETAAELAFAACKAGFMITSGLATGIDAAAHKGALEAGGPTAAVMGTGPERIYPAAHRRLAEHILQCGVLLTEFPPGVGPQRQNFPRRNRIISGMSRGTLVVEAALASGSLITARLAGEQGREVLAVPGSVNNPVARGCHRLIREGARLVESIEDVLEELGFLALGQAPSSVSAAADSPELSDPESLQLLKFIGFDPVFPDQLVELSGLTADAVCSILFSLELKGIIESTPGGAFVRVSKRPFNERKRS